jgi:UDP-N-acetylmuramoylalanine--D-glutamate ligase
MKLTDLKGKRITVMGLGLFGGGTGLTRFLVSHGARVTVTDLKNASQLAPSLEALNGLPVELHLGGHREQDFKGVDMVVVNPAIPKDSRFLNIAQEAGVLLETEMNLFFKWCPAPIVGITGSKGKSTTTALTAAMLSNVACELVSHDYKRTFKKVWLGGNIGLGYSLLEKVEEMGTEDLVVLELSSFQLEDLDKIQKSPHIAVVTNVTPNHLDRHKDMDSYVEAKKTIIRHQTPGDYAILNWDKPLLREWAKETKSRVLWYSLGRDGSSHSGAFLEGQEAVLRIDSREERLRLSGLRLPGRHNLENVLAASSAAFVLGVNAKTIEKALESFSGLEHRLEFVAEINGVKYYNDSIATTPESAIAGLKTFSGDTPQAYSHKDGSTTRRLVLIAGGYDKKLPLDTFAQECAQRCKVVLLLGETAPTLIKLINRFKVGAYCHTPLSAIDQPCTRTVQDQNGSETEVFHVPSLTEAVRLASQKASPGDIVLLSPACASYDMFENFQERGKQFKALVMALTRG